MLLESPNMSKLFCCQVAAGSGTDGADDGGLVAACRDGDLVQLQMMLASGVSPDAQDAHGQRPLILSKKLLQLAFAVSLPFLWRSFAMPSCLWCAL